MQRSVLEQRAFITRADRHRPDFPVPRMAWYAFFVCLVASTIALTVLAHEHTNQVLLISTASSIAGTPVQSTPASSSTRPSINVSASLVRLDQSDVAQYRDQAERDKWSPSACSAASMAAIINASLGRHYRITDILSVEISVGAISASQGLLDDSGIERTMNQFGMASNHGQVSLDEIVTKAEAGTPALVNFPPDTWPGGHFLIVSGGDETSVHLVDSSTLNMAVMSRSTFAKYWRGKAWTFTQEPYSVTGKPTLSVDFINQVLSAYGSPAAGKGQALYDLGVQYGIDPAYALAFFLHESTLGTQGEARTTMSLGNLRCIPDHVCVDKDRGGYAQMASWEDGFQTWYQLIKNYYIDQRGLITVDQIIPVYAPNADHNNEQDYIKALKHYVDTWHAGNVRP